MQTIICCNPSLGLATKARACKVASQERKPGSERKCEGMNPHIPRELPPWELESRCTVECLENDCKGQNSMDWKVIYTIAKLLKRRCLKWARMTHLDIWNTSYGRKKGRKSNWQFDFWPLKVGNRLDFLVWRWHATYRWKDFDKGYNFDLDFISIEGLHAKCHLDVGLVEKHWV